MNINWGLVIKVVAGAVVIPICISAMYLWPWWQKKNIWLRVVSSPVVLPVTLLAFILSKIVQSIVGKSLNRLRRWKSKIFTPEHLCPGDIVVSCCWRAGGLQHVQVPVVHHAGNKRSECDYRDGVCRPGAAAECGKERVENVRK
jgi:hypothetical protein